MLNDRFMANLTTKISLNRFGYGPETLKRGNSSLYAAHIDEYAYLAFAILGGCI